MDQVEAQERPGGRADTSAGIGSRRRERLSGPIDMDRLRRELRTALEDLKREPRDEPDLDESPHGSGEEPDHRRISRAVLARADAGTREGARFDAASARLIRPGEDQPVRSEGGSGGDATRTGPPEAHGDRVHGWIRPEYGAEEGPTGDYWKPVPDRAYPEDVDRGAYGWPVPVERLPVAPAYPPLASGFEPIEESEPTAVVPQWPPARPSDRSELPRTWSVRRWDADPGGRRGNLPDGTKRRPSPRPNGPADAHSTVYVSRHAAEPSSHAADPG